MKHRPVGLIEFSIPRGWAAFRTHAAPLHNCKYRRLHVPATKHSPRRIGRRAADQGCDELCYHARVLTIRREQLLAFSDGRRQRFVSVALQTIANHWPGMLDTRGENSVRRMIASQIEMAARHGFTTEAQVLRYLNVVVALGNDFPASVPWGESLLRESKGTPDHRLDALVRRAHRELSER
jgi:hypothetical protein